jgi:hypothetical protein
MSSFLCGFGPVLSPWRTFCPCGRFGVGDEAGIYTGRSGSVRSGGKSVSNELMSNASRL